MYPTFSHEISFSLFVLAEKLPIYIYRKRFSHTISSYLHVNTLLQFNHPKCTYCNVMTMIIIPVDFFFPFVCLFVVQLSSHRTIFHLSCNNFYFFFFLLLIFLMFNAFVYVLCWEIIVNLDWKFLKFMFSKIDLFLS